MAKNKQYFRNSSDSSGYRQAKGGNENQGGSGDDTLVDIVEVKEQAQDFFEKNQTVLVGALAGLLLLIGGYLGYKYGYLAPREKSGMEAMFQAQNQFKKDSFNLALVNPGGGGEGFLDIIDNYSGTKAANLANYYAGVSYLNLGNYDVAIEYLEDYSANDDLTSITKNGSIGDAYAELGQLDQAAASYQKASSSNNEFLTPYYLNKLAVLSLKQDDKAGAMELFKRIKNDFPESNEATEATKYVSSM